MTNEELQWTNKVVVFGGHGGIGELPYKDREWHPGPTIREVVSSLVNPPIDWRILLQVACYRV